MKLFKKLLIALVFASVASLGYQAQGQQTLIPAGVKLAQKQELLRSNGSEPETLDPNVAESVPAHHIIFDLFESLVSYDKDGKIIGALAETWRRSTPTTWQFFLRKNAKFSDGSPITAKDFVYSARRYLDPKTASPYAGTFGSFIKNGQEVIDGKMPTTSLGVKAVNDYIVEYETVNPTPYLLNILINTQFAPLKQAAVEKFGKDWIKPGNMVSNGAYKLEEWQVNNKIVLVKNPNYWNAKNVTIEKVTFLPIEDTNTDLKLYESGETDYVYQVPLSDLANVQKAYPNEYKAGPLLGLRYYSFNTKLPKLADKKIRQALNMVVDKQILVDKVLADGEIPANSLMIEGVNGGDPTTFDWVKWPMDKRVSYAKQLLKEAGVKDGDTFAVIYNTNDLHKKVTTFLTSEWKTKLGINAKIEVVEFKVLLKRRHDLDYEISRNGWNADYNDATTFITLIACNSPQNDTGYCNKDAQKIFDDAEQQSDPNKRKALINQAVAMVMADYPIIPLTQYTTNRLIKPYVGGYDKNQPLDKHLTKFMYIMEH